MQNVTMILVSNLEKVGIGVIIFLCAYLSNMGLGAWKNVKIEGLCFDWKMIMQSVIKFLVLSISLALLTMAVTAIPIYATYIGIEIALEDMTVIDSLVIIGVFLTATLKYVKDAIDKLKTILI